MTLDELSTAVHQTLLTRSGDVIHPQLRNVSSGYETMEALLGDVKGMNKRQVK